MSNVTGYRTQKLIDFLLFVYKAYNQHPDGRVFETGGISFSCASSEDCECSGLSLSDPAFTTLVVCGLFFFVKLLIEAYLIYCANYLINNNFKNDSKKILRLSESVWLRCVQCRAIAAWQTVMQSYEDGHFYAFQERVFYATTFVNFVFIIISIVGYVDLNESEPGIAIFFIVGSVITVLLMCFSCFVKYQYIQWAQSDDDDTEMATR